MLSMIIGLVAGGGTNGRQRMSSDGVQGRKSSRAVSAPSAWLGRASTADAASVQKAIDDRVAVLAGGRLGMELHADHRMLAMLDGHDLAVIVGRRQHAQRRRQRPGRDDERVIARHPQRRRQRR